MGHLYHISSQESGIIVEEEAERLQEQEVVYDSRETDFV